MPQDDFSQRITQAQSTPSGYPGLVLHEEKVLITVKTYPTPSKKYREIVCTAGITEQGKWIRLYPLEYRYLDYSSWFSKYQWVSLRIQKNTRDLRIDSYRPDLSTLKIISQQLPTKNKWQKRKEIILPTIEFNSLEEFLDNYHKRKVSLCIFKPKKIINFYAERDESEWSKKHQQILNQMVLFGKQTKQLEKITYKFSYEFECNNSRCKGHKLAIRDWEIFQLYRNMKEKKPFDADLIIEKIKQRFLNEMWGEDKDSYLIVGTTLPFSSPIVLGVFWPPR